MGSLPTDNSIVFGRGRAYNSHPGNLKMRLILDNYRDEYKRAIKGEKAQLVRKIHDQLVAGGMNFVKQMEGGQAWVEVDLNTAIQKVGHSLRNPRYRNKPVAAKSRISLAPDRVSSSTSAGVTKAPSTPPSDSSITTEEDGLDKIARMLPNIGSSPQHVGSLVQQGTNLFGGQILASILENHVVEMELERLRSTLPVPMAQSTRFGLLPLYSTNQEYGIAEQDAILSLASGHWTKPVPDDPMFWIRIAAASLSNTGLY